MDGATLQDRLYRASGRTAALIGASCDLLRPHGPDFPLTETNRLLRLPAAFVPLGGKLHRPVTQSDPLWEGLFDAAYTKPGDILRRRTDGAVFFIAAQQPLLPVLCVHAPRLVSITRPAAPNSAGLNLYGGTITATDTVLAQGWPASILTDGRSGTGLANIEAEITPGAWQVLLPPSLHLALRTTDRLTDDQGRTGIIATIESTDLGTRLTAMQAST